MGRLSLCMIARDEAEIIGQALESVLGLVDEIVVVDTGSRDGTAHVASLHGAEILHLPWNDDFAAARNASLEAATGDWILILDADEILLSEDHGTIRRIVETDDTAAWAFCQRNYVDRTDVIGWIPNDGTCEASAPYAGFVEAFQTRLVPRRLGARYTGGVHEEMDASLRRRGAVPRRLDVRVHHFGKVREAAVMERKKALYTLLGERKLAHSPDSVKAWYEMGMQYAEVGRAAEALGAFETLLTLQPDLYFRSRALACMGELHTQAGRPAEAAAILEEALKEDPTLVTLWHGLAHAHVSSGRVSKAVPILEAAIDVFPDRIVLIGYLGMLYVDLCQWDVAEECFDRVRALHPTSQWALYGLAMIPLLRDGADGLAQARPFLREMAPLLGGDGRGRVIRSLLDRQQPELALRTSLDATAVERGKLEPLHVEAATAAGDVDELADALVRRGRAGRSGPGALSSWGEALMGAGRLAAALELHSLAARERHGPAVASRAVSLARLGCGAWAEALLRTLQQDPALAETVDRLLEALGLRACHR